MKLKFRLPSGHAWNPLHGWPALEQCFCLSERRASRCCLPRVCRTIPIEQVSHVRLSMERAMRREARIILVSDDELSHLGHLNDVRIVPTEDAMIRDYEFPCVSPV